MFSVSETQTKECTNTDGIVKTQALYSFPWCFFLYFNRGIIIHTTRGIPVRAAPPPTYNTTPKQNA